jgi:hypothetical protein
MKGIKRGEFGVVSALAITVGCVSFYCRNSVIRRKRIKSDIKGIKVVRKWIFMTFLYIQQWFKRCPAMVYHPVKQSVFQESAFQNQIFTVFRGKNQKF